jgi:GR25 family glycosyltransferase involved in LPS biosynthesis
MDTVPIYCINLDAAPARWERVQRRLAAYGLTARRWRASTPADAAACGRAFVPYLNELQRACALSHYALWEHCVHEGYDRVLILEDDAVFRKDWRAITEARAAQPGWSALFLNVAEKGPKEQWAPCHQQCLAGATLYTAEALQWLVAVFRRLLYAADWMTQVLQENRPCITYFPWLVVQHGVDSHIQEGPPSADLAKVHRLLAAADYGLDNYDF